MSAGSAFPVTPASMARRPQLWSVVRESGCSVWVIVCAYMLYMAYGTWTDGSGATTVHVARLTECRCVCASQLECVCVCVSASGRGEINVL